MITAHTRLAAVLGHPVEHSLSPVIHNAAYRALGVDARYLAFAVEPTELATAVAGLAAAIPGAQQVVIPDCGHLSTLEQPDAVTRALTEHFRAAS